MHCNNKTSKFLVSSPLGSIEGEYCKCGMHAIKVLNPDPDINEGQKVKLIEGEGHEDIVQKCVTWLQNYFSNPAVENDVNVLPNLCPLDTSLKKQISFTQTVWDTLQTKIGPGQTITYAALAKWAGNDKAARAVGSAMKRNPLPLLIPCHRVVNHGGKLGNYSGGGSSIKAWLLKCEGAKISDT